MINDEVNEVIKGLFNSLKNRYQKNWESMKDREFVFNYIHLFYYKCHKINPNHGGSYIDSLDWIKSKKATINLINKKDKKCFQYTITVALNHEEIAKHSQRISKIKPFINKYDWKERNFQKKIEKNTVTIALNVLYAKKEKIYPAYISRHNSNREKPWKASYSFNDSKGKRMELSCSKKLSALLRKITSKHDGNFYCLNCLNSFATEKKRKSHKKYVELKIFVTLKY